MPLPGHHRCLTSIGCALAHHRGHAEVFAIAGFEVEALHSIPEIMAPNLSAYYRKIAVRANSTLTLIDDGDFEQGIERLRQEAAAVSDTEPVVERRDLLVLR